MQKMAVAMVLPSRFFTVPHCTLFLACPSFFLTDAVVFFATTVLLNLFIYTYLALEFDIFFRKKVIHYGAMLCTDFLWLIITR